MLYTGFVMNSKPNIPDEIFLGGSKLYSWRTDLRVNGWLMVAILISAASEIIFAHQVRQLDATLRTLIALAPFLVLVLWMRNLAQWIRGMDELHRRITLAAVLFAVSATFFFVMLWHRLEVAGFFEAICPGRKGWDICTLSHVFLLMTLFYIFGHTLFNRRYK
jgi:uncharacterized membrane protein